MKVKGHTYLWALITWILSLWDGDARATAYCMCYYKTPAAAGAAKGWTEVVVTNRPPTYNCPDLAFTANACGASTDFYTTCGYTTSGGSGSSSGYASCGIVVDRIACHTGGDTTGRPGGGLDVPFPKVEVEIIP